MLSHCLKYKENTERKNSRTKNGKIMLLSRYALCSNKKAKFVTKQEASGLLSNQNLFKQDSIIRIYFLPSA